MTDQMTDSIPDITDFAFEKSCLELAEICLGRPAWVWTSREVDTVSLTPDNISVLVTVLEIQPGVRNLYEFKFPLVCVKKWIGKEAEWQT